MLYNISQYENTKKQKEHFETSLAEIKAADIDETDSNEKIRRTMEIGAAMSWIQEFSNQMKQWEKFQSLKQFNACPFCDGLNTIEGFIEKRNLYVQDTMKEGGVYVYKCRECGEGFTTTESD